MVTSISRTTQLLSKIEYEINKKIVTFFYLSTYIRMSKKEKKGDKGVEFNVNHVEDQREDALRNVTVFI